MKNNIPKKQLAATLAILVLALGTMPGSARAEKFTIAVIPDTREYTRWDYTPPGFMAQTHFIATNRQALNIAFVTHLGDMVKATGSRSWSVMICSPPPMRSRSRC